jgi:hypothetical protein
MSTGSRSRSSLSFTNGVEQGRGNKADLVDQAGTVGGNRLDRNTVEDVQEVTGDGLSFLCNGLLVNVTVEGTKKIVTCLLNDKTDELLKEELV